MRALPAFVVSLTLALALTACGDGDDDSSVSSSQGASKSAIESSTDLTSESSSPSSATTPATPDPRDQAIAERAVLTLDDMPSGWTSEPSDDSDDDDVEEQELATCVGVDVSEVETDANASADSDDFKSPEGVSISSSAEVAADESWMVNAFEIQSSEKFRECLGESAKKAFAEDDDIEWGEVNVSPMVFPTYGDETMGIRVTIPATTQGQDLELTMDMLMARVGRANVTVTATSVNGPVGASELGGYLQTTVDRMQSGLDA